MSKVKKIQNWGIKENNGFTKYRSLGDQIFHFSASVLINFIDTMLISLSSEFYTPQFLVRHESKYFPQSFPKIYSYIQIIKNGGKYNHNTYAKDLNENTELINEFIQLGYDLLKPYENDIFPFLNQISLDLNIQINIYNESSLIHSCKNNSFTEALVLSLLVEQAGGENIYGICYHQKYNEISQESLNLSYEVFRTRDTLTSFQIFDRFLIEALKIFRFKPIKNEFLQEFRRFYFSLKAVTTKSWGFENRMVTIARVPVCSFCDTLSAALEAGCGCSICYECIVAGIDWKLCLNCGNALDEEHQNLISKIKQLLIV